MVEDKHFDPWMTLGIHTRMNFSEYEMKVLARYDFPLGKEGTTQCTDPTNEVLINSTTECMFAADQSGAHILDVSKFQVRNDGGGWQDKHPKGCFKDVCDKKGGVCYFDNLKAGGMPTGTITGTPICQRPRFVKAPAGTNGQCGQVAPKSPGAYQALQDEFLCRVAGTLFGGADAQEFRVGILNASQHLDHPLGCFVDTADGITYYNPPSELSSKIPSTGVRGIQICNVSAVTSWSNRFNGTASWSKQYIKKDD